MVGQILDMVMFCDQVGLVKVKTGELKARLSHYVRWVRESGEGIEVCVREQPVAYLSALPAAARPDAEGADLRQLRARLSAAGLVLARELPASGALPTVTASPAGDGRTDISTVEEMRAERDW